MSEAVDRLWRAFVAVVDDALASHGTSAFETLGQRLTSATPNHSLTPLTQPVVEQLLAPSVDAAPEPWRELALLLAAASPELPWLKSYEHLEPAPEFQPRYSFLLLGAPSFRGYEPAFLLPDALLGLTLQAPHVVYPAHHHEPPEMYGVISGTLDWQVGTTWSTKGPGDVIVHRSHESHSMVTRDDPVLTWAVWPRNPETHVYMPSLDPPEKSMEPTPYC